MEALYGKGKKQALAYLARQALRTQGKVDADIRQRMLARMGDVSAFMKEYKQRFSKWYNRRQERFGTGVWV
ncbi:MAG: hypothetical protein FJ387_19395 [Verrucomicrobia bacterium]|nr:hypothetical protein [Verrucomicrobiota bacterium]